MRVLLFWLCCCSAAAALAPSTAAALAILDHAKDALYALARFDRTDGINAPAGQAGGRVMGSSIQQRAFLSARARACSPTLA